MASPTTLDTVARECIALRMRLLNRVVTRIYDDALRPSGLRASQANVLVAAQTLGVASPRRVCEILDLDPSTLSRNVERMRRKGWIEVVPGKDAREQPLRLTRAGRRLLESCIPMWREGQRRARELLGAGTADRLCAVADRVQRRGEGS